MRDNPLKARLAAGGRAYGATAFEFFPPGLPQICADAGAEIIVYGMEHGGPSLEALETQAGAHADQRHARRRVVTTQLRRAKMLLVPMVALLMALPAAAFDLQGHRGARGLAPENTLAGFKRALEIGVSTLETDVVVTRDGVPVIAHDPYVSPDLARGAGGAFVSGKGTLIRSLTLAELKERYDIGRLNLAGSYARQWPEQLPQDGERYPTLAELLQLIKASGRPVRLNLETKLSPERPDDTPPPAEFARIVVDVLRQEGFLERTTLQSFDWRTLAEARRLVPALATSCLTVMGRNFDNVKGLFGRPSAWTAGFSLAKYDDSVPRLVQAAGCGTWAMHYQGLTPGDLALAKSLGLTVLPWTVNDPADMERLIAMGVDGIITDYPNRLRAVLAQRGMPLP